MWKSLLTGYQNYATYQKIIFVKLSCAQFYVKRIAKNYEQIKDMLRYVILNNIINLKTNIEPKRVRYTN
jgi:hypothetical protein